MIEITVKCLASWCSGRLQADLSDDASFTELVTDSRKISKGCVFVALKGERFDAHDFVADAVCKGAALAIVEEGRMFDSALPLLYVGDTLKALGDIARGYLREYFPDLRITAVTGSVGKTSTKEMIAYVLGREYKTKRTPMNFNNEIGLPLTVLSLEKGDEALVVEMGMRGFNQISYLSEIVNQDATVITNIGSSHLELLGTRENILRAKMECCVAGLNALHIKKKPYKLVINADNDMLSDEERLRSIAADYGCDEDNLEIITFGTGGNCMFCASAVLLSDDGVRYTLISPQGEHHVYVPVMGMHTVYNSLAAIACGYVNNTPVDNIVTSLAMYGEDTDKAIRQRIVRMSNCTLIDDTYNASPESMKASLDVLAQIGADCNIAALGDMLELGEQTEVLHKQVGEYARKIACDIYAVGDKAHIYLDPLVKERYYTDSASCADIVAEAVLTASREASQAGKSVAVLVKGSNAMKMGVISQAIIDTMKAEETATAQV